MSDRDAPLNGRLHRIRDCHFDCYLDLARLANDGLGDADDESSASLLTVFDAELANFRSALDWGLSTGRPETAALAASLRPYWNSRRLFVEGRRILDRVLLVEELSLHDRVDVLLAAGDLAEEHGDRADARDHYALARQSAKSAGDPARQARAARGHGWMLYLLLANRDAADAFTEALEIGEGLSVAERADMLRGLGWARASYEGQAIALEFHRQARKLLEEADVSGLPIHYLVEAKLLTTSGRAQEALELADKALTLAQSGIGPLSGAFEARANAAQALGDGELLRASIADGIAAARAESSPMWEAVFSERLAHDAMARGQIEVATDAVDGALGRLDAMKVLNARETGFRARLLGIRGRLAEDAGDLDLAHEVYRQAAASYSDLSPLSHAAALAAIARLLAAHGGVGRGRIALSRAIALVDGLEEWSTSDLRAERAMFDDDLEEALRLVTESLAAYGQRGNQAPPVALSRRAALLAELGRVEEAAAVLDEAVIASEAGDRHHSHLDRAIVRIALGDATGARSDLEVTAAAAAVGWADDQLQFATTLARLALLEGRHAEAGRLWTAVVEYRTANQRSAPPLSRRFEKPLQELTLSATRPVLDSRAALKALRALVSEEFTALALHTDD